MKYIIPFLVLIFLSSCFTQKKNIQLLNSWLGHYKSELIQQWGPPTIVEPNEPNGEILIYAVRTYYTTQYGTVDYWQYRMMYTDSRGKINHWFYKRMPNPPDRVDLRVLRY